MTALDLTKAEIAQILTFAIAPALGAGAAWWAVRSRIAETLSPAGFRRLAIWSWLLTRVGTFLVVFPLFGYAGCWDLLGAWVPIAEAVLAGQDPSPFVDNLYGPLYPFVLAGGLWLGGGSYAPAAGLGFLVGDIALLWLLLRIARRRVSESTARRILLLVLLSPILWHGVTVRAQDEPLFVALLLAVQDLLDRRRERWAAVAAMFGTLVTKALFPLYVLPVLVAANGAPRDRIRRVLLAGGATLGGLGLALAAGWQPTTEAHGALSVRGSSVWWLVTDAELTRTAFTTGLLVTAALCVGAAYTAWVRRAGEASGERAARGVVAVQGAFFATCPFTLGGHLVHGLAHFAWRCVTAPGRRALVYLIPFLALQVLAIWLPVETWRRLPLLIAALGLWSAWTVWETWTASRGPRAPPDRDAPGHDAS